MGCLEVFFMVNKFWCFFFDGVGNGLGYGVILVVVGVVCELFGKGSLFVGSLIELKIIGLIVDYLVNMIDSMLFGWYVNNNLMVLLVLVMFIIGIMIWI